MSFARDEEIRRLRIENRRLRYEIKLMKAKTTKIIWLNQQMRKRRRWRFVKILTVERELYMEQTPPSVPAQPQIPSLHGIPSALHVLAAVADIVLAYRPKSKTKAAKRRKRRDQYAKRRRSESSI